MHDPFAVLDLIDDRCTLENHTERFVQFMIASCDLIRSILPHVAVESLEVARRYWAGEANTAELDEARVSCWLTIDAAGSGITFDKPWVCGTRAVICVLYPTLDDVFDVVHWFIELSNKAEDHTVEQEHILRSLFADVLECRRG